MTSPGIEPATFRLVAESLKKEISKVNSLKGRSIVQIDSGDRPNGLQTQSKSYDGSLKTVRTSNLLRSCFLEGGFNYMIYKMVVLKLVNNISIL
jgi:hypothetical protein